MKPCWTRIAILHIFYLGFCMICYQKGEITPILHCKIRLCFWSFFQLLLRSRHGKHNIFISDWLHTPYQTIFIVIYWIFKISSLFDHYLWNSPVKRGGQPHGSDQCGYIHLLYRFIFCFTVVGVEHLCRLGCDLLIHQRSILSLPFNKTKFVPWK